MTYADSVASSPGLEADARGARLAGDGAPAAGAPAQHPAIQIRGRRSPWIAAFLAMFPGLGSVYNGSYGRGVTFFLTILGLINLANRSSEIWGFAVAFVWLFNMIDAHREARLIQVGIAQDQGALRRPPASSVAEGIGLGLALLLIGLLSFLDATMGIDVEWVFELWPIGLMMAGAWFVFAGIARWRRARAASTAAAALAGYDSWRDVSAEDSERHVPETDS